jgi:hypothetical protein
MSIYSDLYSIRKQQQQLCEPLIDNLYLLFICACVRVDRSVAKAVVLMQLEVAQRIVAPPNCKEYGILSVVFQVRYPTLTKPLRHNLYTLYIDCATRTVCLARS